MSKGCSKKTLVVCQSVFPHYRKYLLDYLSESYEMKLFCYGKYEEGLLDVGRIFHASKLPSVSILGWEIFSILRRELFTADFVVLQGNMRHISNIFILFFRRLIGRSTIVLGHGLSASNHFTEIERKFNFKGAYYSLFDLCWFYTKDVHDYWRKSFWNINSVAINNTLKFENLPTPRPQFSSLDSLNFLAITRFNSQSKLGYELLEYWRENNYLYKELIVIGGGSHLPAVTLDGLSSIGEIYEEQVKRKYIEKAHFFIHLGWVGLSIVEALYHGLPVITLKRSRQVTHSVEYVYLQDGYNAIIVDSLDDLNSRLSALSLTDYAALSKGASDTYESIHPALQRKIVVSSLGRL